MRCALCLLAVAAVATGGKIRPPTGLYETPTASFGEAPSQLNQVTKEPVRAVAGVGPGPIGGSQTGNEIITLVGGPGLPQGGGSSSFSQVSSSGPQAVGSGPGCCGASSGTPAGPSGPQVGGSRPIHSVSVSQAAQPAAGSAGQQTYVQSQSSQSGQSGQSSQSGLSSQFSQSGQSGQSGQSSQSGQFSQSSLSSQSSQSGQSGQRLPIQSGQSGQSSHSTGSSSKHTQSGYYESGSVGTQSVGSTHQSVPLPVRGTGAVPQRPSNVFLDSPAQLESHKFSSQTIVRAPGSSGSAPLKSNFESNVFLSGQPRPAPAHNSVTHQDTLLQTTSADEFKPRPVGPAGRPLKPSGDFLSGGGSNSQSSFTHTTSSKTEYSQQGNGQFPEAAVLPGGSGSQPSRVQPSYGSVPAGQQTFPAVSQGPLPGGSGSQPSRLQPSSGPVSAGQQTFPAVSQGTLPGGSGSQPSRLQPSSGPVSAGQQTFPAVSQGTLPGGSGSQTSFNEVVSVQGVQQPAFQSGQLLNQNPGLGGSGPLGHLLRTCSTSLVCVPIAMCNPYTGFVRGGLLFEPEEPTLQPTVALDRCSQLKDGGSGDGVCCQMPHINDPWPRD